MPEVIMQYEDYEGKMIAMKRKEELIRCKDCKYRNDHKWCEQWFHITEPDGHCEEGKRKIE